MNKKNNEIRSLSKLFSNKNFFSFQSHEQLTVTIIFLFMVRRLSAFLYIRRESYDKLVTTIATKKLYLNKQDLDENTELLAEQV